jgi:hypothetical protein
VSVTPGADTVAILENPLPGEVVGRDNFAPGKDRGIIIKGHVPKREPLAMIKGKGCEGPPQKDFPVLDGEVLRARDARRHLKLHLVPISIVALRRHHATNPSQTQRRARILLGKIQRLLQRGPAIGDPIGLAAKLHLDSHRKIPASQRAAGRGWL